MLALAPLALAEPLTGLVSALQRRGALADAQGRLDAVLTAPVPADPARAAPAPAPVTELAVDELAAGWPGGRDVLRDLTAPAAAGTAGWWCAARRASGKSTLLAVLMASLRPRAAPTRLDGVADAAAGRGRPAGADGLAAAGGARLRLDDPGQPGAGRPARRAGRTGGRGADARGADRRPDSAALLAGLPDGLDTPVGAGGTVALRRRAPPAGGRAGAAGRPRRRPARRADRAPGRARPPGRWSRDLRTALAGRVVVCVTHDDLEEPGDTVVHLGESAVRAT